MHDVTDDTRTTEARAPSRRTGTIATLTGCMFSGKTTQMLRRLDGCAVDSARVFKHAVDTRYMHDAVVSHDGTSVPAVTVRSSNEITEHLHDGLTTIGIDEGHFFDGALPETVQALGESGLHVLITMLDRDSWGRLFPVTRKLHAIADEMVMMHADCAQCHRPANRTQRLTPIIGGNMVGGSESYEPRCLECWRAPGEAPPII